MSRFVGFTLSLLALATLLILPPAPVLAQQVAGTRDTEEPPALLPSPDFVIKSFIRAETQVREALNQHTFKRDVLLQTIGPEGDVTGEYIRNSQFLFDDRGNRIERVTYHPASTIKEMKITREDIQDLAGAQLLGIDITESSKYQLSYLGEGTLDSKRVYQIAVTPNVKPNPHKMSERFFRGEVWIDTTTFQVIKVRGVVEPQGKQRFPLFETFREPVTDSLRLPTRTQADDVLRFPKYNVNYRIRVKYYDYKLFGSKLTVTEIDNPDHD